MTAIHIFKTDRYTLFIEAPTREEARRMTPMLASYPEQRGARYVPLNTNLSNDDVRAILASSSTYSELAKLFMVSVTTISKVRRRVVRANLPFDGEVAKSSSPPGRKPKGTL